MELFYSLSELPEVAEKVLDFSQEKVFLFYGPMGAGKTTLIKEMCKRMGVKDTASSPSFGIVNEYASPSGPVYHFDFYRIKDEEEALDIGIEEYFYSGRPVLIEWPEKINSYLPESGINIEISKTAQGNRKIILSEFPNI